MCVHYWLSIKPVSTTCSDPLSHLINFRDPTAQRLIKLGSNLFKILTPRFKVQVLSSYFCIGTLCVYYQLYTYCMAGNVNVRSSQNTPQLFQAGV